MKKLVCFLLAGAMASTSVCAFAEAPTISAMPVISDSNSKALSLESALAKVKSKIDIPSEFSDFNSNTNKHGNTVSYSFNWSTQDGEKAIGISCDGHGRIESYWRYENSDDKSARLGNVDKETALNNAESFLLKALPEVFISENDKPVYNPLSYYGYMSGQGTSYSFSFVRQKDGVEVSSNSVYMSLKISGDSLYVENLNVDYDYDAKFEEPGVLLENPEHKYKEVFPLELVYETEYDHDFVPLDARTKDDKNETKTVLKYRINNPNFEYISAYTGEKVSERADMSAFKEKGMSAKSLAEGGNGGDFAPVFTPEELKEIQSVANLKSASQIETSLRKLPNLKMQNMKLDSSNIYKKGDSDDDYTISLSFINPDSDTYDGMYVQTNAKTGEITSISKSCRYDNKIEKLSESKLMLAKSKADEFIKAAAPDKAVEYEMTYSSDNSGVVYITYTRVVNGIKYNDDTLSIDYNTNDGSICNYYINYTKDAVFADAKNVVSAEDAYAELLKVSPLNKIYIRTEDGIYKLCLAANYNSYTDIDALTGKPFDYAADKTGEYSDISGHWCESTVKKLADVGVALPGDKFNPDDAITGKDLWNLFDSALGNYQYYKIINDTLVCDSINSIPDSAKDAPVTREDACVYLASMTGYSKIAKHYDIFRANFADSDQIAPEKIGYAAIMSALGAVNGSGGILRPKDSITRAEAAVMLYNYLVNN